MATPLIVFLIVYLVGIMICLLVAHASQRKREHERELERLKARIRIDNMKAATQLTYGEKQRLDFALGRHRKRRG